MTEVGFKRMKIQPFDASGNPVGDRIVIEGKKDKGGTSTADISGLSKDPATVAASNVVYYISRKGVGDVKVDFGILDFPDSDSDRVLGYQTDATNKITYIGEKTEAPYCGVELEAENLQGEAVLLGFFKGVFSRDKITLSTLDPKETFKPEATAYTFTAAASDADGPQNGNYVGKYIGSDAEAVTALEEQVLGKKVADSTGV